MRARPHKDDDIPIQAVNQQKIASYVTFPVVSPLPLQRVIKPLGTERCIVGDEKQHRLFQTLEVITARAGKAVPILEEGLGVVARPGRAWPAYC